jgi:hypothetical protein
VAVSALVCVVAAVVGVLVGRLVGVGARVVVHVSFFVGVGDAGGVPVIMLVVVGEVEEGPDVPVMLSVTVGVDSDGEVLLPPVSVVPVVFAAVLLVAELPPVVSVLPAVVEGDVIIDQAGPFQHDAARKTATSIRIRSIRKPDRTGNGRLIFRIILIRCLSKFAPRLSGKIQRMKRIRLVFIIPEKMKEPQVFGLDGACRYAHGCGISFGRCV